MLIKRLKRLTPRIVVVGVIIGLLIIPLIPNSVFAATRDLYWFGGTGNWNDTAHWSLSSNNVDLSAPQAVPDADDNVHFDLNSFTGAGQVISVNVAGDCLNLDFTGVTNNPTFSVSGGALNIYGSLVYSANMIVDFSASLTFIGTGNQTITTNNVAMAHCGLVVNSATLTLTIQDSWNSPNNSLSVQAGTFDTNGKTITCGNFRDNGSAAAKTVTLGNSTINCTTWNFASGNLTLTANTSTINVSSSTFAGGGVATYNAVNLIGATSTISGSNTFSTLALSNGTTQTITFTDGTTQTASTFTLSGSSGHVHTLQGSGAAGWNLSDASGINSADFISISRCTAGGGATFNATGQSVDGDNNVGWNFIASVTTNALTNQAAYTATGNGNVTDGGGKTITERGVCWNTTGTPTTANSKATSAGTFGTYTVSITGLTPLYTYYMRSYFVNSNGTTYGAEITYTPQYAQASSQLGNLAIPIVFLALGILLILSFNFESISGTDGIKTLLYIAIIIMILFALLAAFQPQLNTLP
jgi:hypothetical protein